MLTTLNRQNSNQSTRSFASQLDNINASSQLVSRGVSGSTSVGSKDDGFVDPGVNEFEYEKENFKR